ncbi:DUF1109 domain-containing protein [Dongia rigui]|uniref:DUF1109 domain-containing protein n=1 Tax=Dongia rigui TaxID=940149 RepID=A0ABU5DU49_9PROT|nr:DUF1109 domain-containing protein [Dongia rigui]MDY0870469.1 DUF1109 domain-containing protein [Dongia rigui]
MKTDDLISGLVADQGRPPARAQQILAVALPLALIVSLLVFVVELRIRADFLTALGTWRYLFKFATAGSIALFGLVLLLEMARPEQSVRRVFLWLPLALAPLLLSVAMEMVMLPTDQWGASAIGFYPLYCLCLVPAISLAPLAAGLYAMRRGAPQSPTMAGAAAGFAAGGIGAFIYSVHCDNDSPFYVAIWYLGAIVIVTILGALIGRRVLRW